MKARVILIISQMPINNNNNNNNNNDNNNIDIDNEQLSADLTTQQASENKKEKKIVMDFSTINQNELNLE
ncbi:hypothetical protein RFI_32653 [Reticulomyxa filosa]|uniref:Uncharacterized protein n=1 Tax=Reticulomyxa filosa TaxID=46433 RepID=X6LS71_RETFI|nr:hypothetical protein RFI_32653 [Reticulomyxa filosa]|eukprot:ETO04743.1 hypothetical protein RFI_32653 [Reticulomyxa filosa]